MFQKRFVKRLIKLQKEFKALYRSGGPLTGVSDDYVHIRPEVMADIVPLEKWDLNIRRSNSSAYPYEHRVTVDGVLFLAITTDPIWLNPQFAPEQEYLFDGAGE